MATTTRTRRPAQAANQNGSATAAKQSQSEPAVTALMPRNVADSVSARVHALTSNGELHLPANYSAENALKAAWLAMQNSESVDKLMKCSRESMAEALLDMVIQGLNPAKDQCYFIPYGTRCVCMRSYIGSIALLKRIYGPKSRVWPVVVYDGDTIEKGYSRGRLTINRHELGPNDGNDDKVVAAYCVVEPEDEEPYTEWMSIDQIMKAWAQGGTKGNSPAHKGFGGEMAKKTVINRACKILIKSSDDSYLAEAMERQELMTAEAVMDAEIEQHANRELIDVESVQRPETDAEVVEAESEATVEEAGADELSPADRFSMMVADNDLDPTNARKLIVETKGLDDARKITNEMYAEAVDNTEQFVSAYRAKYDKEPATLGPGW